MLVASGLLVTLPSHALEFEMGGESRLGTFCELFILRETAGIPDLNKPHWVVVAQVSKTTDTMTSGMQTFTFTFYRDTRNKTLTVAAMKVSVGLITRLTWQVDEEIRTVRLELPELVCVKRILTVSNERYDLKNIKEAIINNKNNSYHGRRKKR